MSKPPQWRIPVEDILAVGWKAVDAYEEPTEQALDKPSERVRELEALLEVERAKRAAAERVAELAQQNADDLRMALRMIEAAPVKQPEQVPEQVQIQPTEAPPEPAPKRRWWQF